MAGKLNREGFITNWLISGPKLADFSADCSFDDQLAYEKYMRSVLRDGRTVAPPEDIALDQNSDLDMPWRYIGGGNWFVDVSNFYLLPTRVELYACADLLVDQAMEMCADLWTYTAIDLWVNGELTATVERPVYKPIIRKPIALKLKRGANRIFIRMQNLGVRDTRNIIGLQFKEATEAISVSLPGDGAEELIALDTALRGACVCGEVIRFTDGIPAGVSTEPQGSPLPDGAIQLPGGTKRAMIKGSGSRHELMRAVEIIGNIKPAYIEQPESEEGRRDDLLHRLAESKGAASARSIFSVIARYTLGLNDASDHEAIRANLKRIHDRVDCSDFTAAGVIRLVKMFDLDSEIFAEIRKTFLHYRFWMDQNGADGMCFWSENHALLFHGAQMLAGGMYPDDLFSRSGLTGRQQEALGAERCRDWLDDVAEHGFEEFISSGYMSVTIGALINLVDYGPEDISKKAAHVTDMMLKQLSRHTFKGSVFGPQGRVYRDVITPFEQGVQAIINYVNPATPFHHSEWMIFPATSKYRVPDGLVQMMNAVISDRYGCANAEIALEKRKNYLMTSVASPRADDGLRWRGICFDENPDRGSNLYTMSLNERFHGTTDFRPGVYGYQQHLWYAALDPEALVFTNHPGGTVDSSSMRPGYWYGNGVFPAVKQEKNLLGAVYAIPDDHPIHFTHLYFPAEKFEDYFQRGNWLFARKGEAWLGVWCSEPLEWHDDMLAKCELRAHGDKSAWLCLCSDKAADGSFGGFIARCEALPVLFDRGRMLLTCGDFALRYAVHFDNTQYV